jgi:hypothetical protein
MNLGNGFTVFEAIKLFVEWTPVFCRNVGK